VNTTFICFDICLIHKIAFQDIKFKECISVTEITSSDGTLLFDEKVSGKEKKKRIYYGSMNAM